MATQPAGPESPMGGDGFGAATQQHFTGPTMLVTGPTGKVGRRLIPLLARRAMIVRAASRSPLAARAGIEPVHFDWADRGTYEAARNGVEAIYLVPGPIPRPEHAGYIRDLL